MPLTDQWQGYTGMPGFGDPSNVPTDLLGVFDFLAARAVPRYATVAARDAELSAPADGQLAWVDVTNSMYIRSGGAWRVVWTSTPWVDLTASLIAPAVPATSKLRARAVQGTVTIAGEVLGSFPDVSGAVNILDPFAIPEDLRPADGQGDGRTLVTGTTYLTAAYPGGILARPDGSLAYFHRTGSSERGSIRFTLTYPQA